MDFSARIEHQPVDDGASSQLTPVTVAQNGSKLEKESGGAHKDHSCWQRFLMWLDAYQVQERNPDRVGLPPPGPFPIFGLIPS